nr:MAG TPA: protein of unknown function (DUF1936) [Caudoviricetes sp.]
MSFFVCSNPSCLKYPLLLHQLLHILKLLIVHLIYIYICVHSVFYYLLIVFSCF